MSSNVRIPSTSPELVVSIPAPHVLLLRLNRPKALNAMSTTMTEDLDKVLTWAESEPEIWALIITGTGRAFCAGADLKAWLGTADENSNQLTPDGFGAISRCRTLTKPLIAAVNGIAFGGGLEMLSNCDLIVATKNAKFAYPEVSRGVVASQGGIPRSLATMGQQLASELLLTGKPITADEARDRYRFVNEVVANEADLLPAALRFAGYIVDNSPEAVQSTKKALLLAKELGMEDSYQAHLKSPESLAVYGGENYKEGLRAFTEKREPKWKNPAPKAVAKL